LENLKVRDHSEDLDVDGRMTLERILGRREGRGGVDASASGSGPVAGCYEQGNVLRVP